MTQPQPDEKFLPFDRRDLAVLAALFVLAVVILWPIVAADSGMAPGMLRSGGRLHDGRSQWYPWRAYAAEGIKEGVLPLWNPYVLCGTPFVGNIQSAVFYPPNLIFAAMPIHLAARLSVLFHIMLSLVFMYLLARCFGCVRAGAAVAAMVFSFGAAQLLRVPAGHWGVSCAIPWTPLIFLCVEALLRKPGIAALIIGAVAVGLQILAGVPQYVLITGLAVSFFVVIRSFGQGFTLRSGSKRYAAVACMFILGAAIAAIQLLPAIEAARHGARSLPMRSAWIQDFSLAPECLLTLFVPGFFGGASWWGRFNFWEMNAYLGAGIVPLAVLGLFWRKNRRLGLGLGILAVLMLMLALGRHTPFMRLLSAILPIGGMFRGASKFLHPFQLAMALLAGLGVSVLLQGSDRDRQRGVILSVAALVLTLLVVLLGAHDAFIPWLCNILRQSDECLDAAIRSGAAPVAAFKRFALLSGSISVSLCALLIVGLVVLKRTTDNAVRVRLVAIICILLAVDMILFSQLFISKETNFNAVDSSWPSDAARVLRYEGARYRTLFLSRPTVNDAMLARVPVAEGIEPNPPKRFHLLFRRAQGLPEDVAPSLYQLIVTDQERANAAWRMMAIGRVLVTEQANLPETQPQVFWSSKEATVFNAHWGKSPRAFIAYGAHVPASEEDALNQTLALGRNNQIVLEQPDLANGFHGRRGSPPTPAQIIERGPNHVVVQVAAMDDGWLVLMDNFYPGWKAVVDGVEQPIYPANCAFRAVPVRVGEHRIVFTYKPDSVKWGFITSLAAMAVSGMLMLWSLIRKRSAAVTRPG